MDLLGEGAGYLSLFLRALKSVPLLKAKPVRSVFNKQIYFTGVEALGTISVIATLIGFVIVTEVANLVGSSELTGKVLVWVVVREMGPLFSAILIIARSGTAVASELGSMKISGEVTSLRLMGIDPADYLIVPRVAGIIISVFALTVYFQMMAVAGGLALSSAFLGSISVTQHIKGILSALSGAEIAVSLLKSLVFGVVISTVVCRQGSGVRSSITEIPQAATRAVMRSIFLVIVFDGLITFMWFL